jgi:hypothetical protein
MSSSSPQNPPDDSGRDDDSSDGQGASGGVGPRTGRGRLARRKGHARESRGGARTQADKSTRSSSVARASLAVLIIGALGVVFGDIGTSPLYALKTVFTVGDGAVPLDRAGVYGVISMVFWSITLVVSVKYVAFVMRADNEG